MDPDSETCNKASYVDFENFGDKADLSQASFPGIEFTTTGGYTWRVGDFSTGNYNGKYPSGSYTSQANKWAWLGEQQGAGRITFTIGRASYVSVLVSANSHIELEAYNDAGKLLETASSSTGNTGTGKMDKLSIQRSNKDIKYVIVHDTGNYFLIDGLCTDNVGAGLDDTDGDGIPDTWETNGVDVNNDGKIDLDLKAMGADPNHKDVFVEVDWLTKKGGPLGIGGWEATPSTSAINKAESAYAQFPVVNPDHKAGIRLHIDAGASAIMNPVTGATWGSRSRANAIVDGKRFPQWAGWSQLDVFKSANLDAARQKVFHYVIYGDEIGCDKGQCTTGISRGIPGRDLIIAKGSNGVSGDTQEAVTIAHELGHNLGLGHGGRDRDDDHETRDANRKANYLSIMNYYYSNRGLKAWNAADGVISFSPQELDTMHTDDLDEVSGLNPDPYGHWEISFKCPNGKVKNGVDSYKPVDWNCDGKISDGGSNPNLQESGAFKTSNKTLVLGSSDYDHLKFWGVSDAWDARNKAMTSFAQPGTKEQSISQAKKDGLWWPSRVLVPPSNPALTVYTKTGQIRIPIKLSSPTAVSVKVQPALAKAKGFKLSSVKAVTVRSKRSATFTLKVDSRKLKSGRIVHVRVSFKDVKTGQVTTMTMTVTVRSGARPSKNTCTLARRSLGKAGLTSVQRPAIKALVRRCSQLKR